MNVVQVPFGPLDTPAALLATARVTRCFRTITASLASGSTPSLDRHDGDYPNQVSSISLTGCASDAECAVGVATTAFTAIGLGGASGVLALGGKAAVESAGLGLSQGALYVGGVNGTWVCPGFG